MDPILTAAIAVATALIGAVGTFLTMRESKKAEKSTVILDGFEALLKSALEQNQEIIRQNTEMKNEVGALREEIADLNSHIDALNDVLRSHNITPPARRKRGATVEG